MKYRAAATLGEVVACDGSLVARIDEERSRWRFDLTDAADPSRVFVSAEAVMSWPGDVALPPGTTVSIPPSGGPTATGPEETKLLQPLPEGFADSPKTLEVVVWSDDLDGGGELSIRALLNYFERIRTLSLGRGSEGELGLMRLHREGVSVVVRALCLLGTRFFCWWCSGWRHPMWYDTSCVSISFLARCLSPPPSRRDSTKRSMLL